MPWSSSNRRSQLPNDWQRRRAHVKAQAAGQCQQIADGQRCPQPGTDCDHIDRFLGHELTNLQWLCSEHHKAKTRAEAQAAKPPRRRPPQKHPGLL